MSAAAPLQSQVDFLKGNPHKKHPGVTNLKTLHLPEELQTAARSIILSRLSCESVTLHTVQDISVASLCDSPVSPPAEASVPRLKDRARSLTNVLWSRKRAVEDVILRKKAVGLEKELWEKAMQKRGGGCCMNYELVMDVS